MFSYAQELKRTILSTIMSSGVVAREQDIIESNCYKKKKMGSIVIREQTPYDFSIFRP